MARFLTHAGSGHATDSSVPSVIASVQQDATQSWQLLVSNRRGDMAKQRQGNDNDNDNAKQQAAST